MGKFTINKNIKKETDDVVKIDKHFYLMFVGICNNINSIHYKYLNTYKKFIPVPKKEISEINGFDNLTSYIFSDKKWSKLYNFIFILREQGIGVNEYFEEMIKNWFKVKNMLNIADKKLLPSFNMIASEKLINIYKKIKNVNDDIEKDNKDRKLVNIKNTDSIIKSYNSDILSLFRLKSLNNELSYKEIITIFSAEFDESFKNEILKLDDTEITKEKLLKLKGV